MYIYNIYIYIYIVREGEVMRGRYTIKLRQNHGFIGGFKPFTTVTVTVGHMPNLLEMEVFFYDKLSSNVPGVWLKHAIVFYMK